MKFDAVIVGGGHNGLTTAAYLAKKLQRVLVLESRHLVGGAAVTEELIPGFKFSRGSYLSGLLRPKVISELNLASLHNLTLLPRPHHSFTPSLIHEGQSLLMSNDMVFTQNEIAKFSAKDAAQYPLYCDKLSKFARILDNVIDSIPPDISHPQLKLNATKLSSINFSEHLQTLQRLIPSVAALSDKNDAADFISLLLAPAEDILNSHFESEILKSTLATDAVIGALVSPKTPGSGYVLLHHVMNDGNWSYVEGGMGGERAKRALM
tara:strand:+ start:195 stop:989 length:795 start_codon:yes stop_codon:yes gene_type:complete